MGSVFSERSHRLKQPKTRARNVSGSLNVLLWPRGVQFPFLKWYFHPIFSLESHSMPTYSPCVFPLLKQQSLLFSLVRQHPKLSQSQWLALRWTHSPMGPTGRNLGLYLRATRNTCSLMSTGYKHGNMEGGELPPAILPLWGTWEGSQHSRKQPGNGEKLSLPDMFWASWIKSQLNPGLPNNLCPKKSFHFIKASLSYISCHLTLKKKSVLIEC